MVVGAKTLCLWGGLALLSLAHIQQPNKILSDLIAANQPFDVTGSEGVKLTIDVPSELKSIVDGSLSLISMSYDWEDPASLDKAEVSFCALDWSVQKNEPQTFPRYQNLISVQKEVCDQTKVTFSLQKVLMFAQSYDQSPSSKATVLEQGGFIFHESRSGSTLAANMLTVADPRGHRVYSEPTVLQHALATGSKTVVRSILYLMSRSNDPEEKRVFFKLRSTCARRIKYMPDGMKWMFFYRNPTDVLQSHFNPTEEKVGSIVCLTSRDDPSESEVKIASAAGYSSHEKLTGAGVCAVRFASLSHAAIGHYNRTKEGRFVNYNTVPASLWDTHFPEYFDVKLKDDALKRVQAVAGVYSKGSVKTEAKAWDSQPDDESKAKPHVKKNLEKAAKEFMQTDYDWMDATAKKIAHHHHHHHHHH